MASKRVEKVSFEPTSSGIQLLKQLAYAEQLMLDRVRDQWHQQKEWEAEEKVREKAKKENAAAGQKTSPAI
ncbi:hypothetical protein IAR50_006235 [Cryptococcus sp. DSM 104548]